MRSIPPIKCICSAANNWFNCAPLNGKPRSNCESSNLIQTWCNIERGGGIIKSPQETLCQYLVLTNLWQLGRGINSVYVALRPPCLAKVYSGYAPLECHIHVYYPMLRILQK